MDKVLYTAMSGATRMMDSQQVRANNLANISTTGFKGDFNNAFALAVEGEGYDSRVHSEIGEQWTDMSGGTLSQTGRSLDLAIQGEGWFTLMDDQGNEAYSRAGNFHVDGEGVLRAANGMMVSGDGGPITVPDYQQIVVADNGGLSVLPDGADQDQVMVVDNLKLVNPPSEQISKGDDGLFRAVDGQPVDVDPAVSLVSGYLEGSNVNAVSEMVSFMTLSRGFEMQLKMMQSAETIAESGDTLLRD
ncbi:flagellar basal-body rod protein FlgF [Endozoicomonas sp. (ex Bugula neritina AB1)]|nr:flagellar basal-body rod protein FlgF [Endozoicomonas sp. (ex Bugula neritina AB1)]